MDTNSTSPTSTTIAFPSSAKKATDEATQIFIWAVYLQGEIVAIFGTGANIVNIICFVKQGLKVPINVSFLGLAVSDLGSSAFLLWSCICLLPGFQKSGVPFEPVEFQYLITGWPHVVCTRTTSWITALITVERCLCITVPLKVKSIISPTLVTLLILFVFIFNISGVIPIYIVSRFAWVFSSERNRTMLTIVYTDNRAIAEQICNAIVNVFSPFSSYVVVITFTLVLVAQLQHKAKWRMKCTDPQKVDSMLERDQKVAKMVVMISTLYIACCIPFCCFFIAMIVEPRISIDGEYRDVLLIFGGISLLLNSLNSAMNIFIYYRMSSKYRSVFKQLFAREQRNVSG